MPSKMQKAVSTIVLLFIIINLSVAMDYEVGCKMILDFFKNKNIKIGSVILCWDSVKIAQLWKHLSYNGIRVQMLNSIDRSTQASNVLISYKMFYYQAVVLDFNCNNSQYFLSEASKQRMFNTAYHWLIFDTSPSFKSFDTLKRLNLNIDTEMTMVTPAGGDGDHQDVFLLHDVYNPGFNWAGSLNITRAGSWSPENGFTIKSYMKQIKFERRANMSGIEIKCMIVVTHQKLDEPFEDYLISHKDHHIDSMHRFNYALISHVRDIYNFRLKMSRTKSWGYLHNNTFDGMIGEMVRKKIDLGGSPVFFRIERAQVVDYTVPTWTARPCFIFRHPNTSGHVGKGFLSPFDSQVWISAIAQCLLVVTALRLAIIVEHLFFTNLFLPRTETSWSFAGLLTLGALCQQGSAHNPSLTSGRIVVLHLFLFAVIFYQFYSASVVSSLLMTSSRNIKTLKNLVDSPLQAGIEDIGYNRDFFNKTTDPLALELFDRKLAHRMFNPTHPVYLNPTEGLRRVQHGAYAFHVDIATAYKIIEDTFSEREVCDLVEIRLLPKHQQRMMSIIQKGSPFRKTITYGLRKVAESGLMSRQRKVWHSPKPQCVRQISPHDLIVGIGAVSMAILILLGGFITAGIVLCVESWYYRRQVGHGYPVYIN